MDRNRIRVASIIGASLALLSCVVAEPERKIYDRGEIGWVVIRNLTHDTLAVGGCNPSHYDQRIADAWRPDPLLRPACVFGTNPDGSHQLQGYELIRPRGALRVPVPTTWVRGSDAVIRLRQRVSAGCQVPARRGEPIHCASVLNLVSDPILIVEPGTADDFARD
jgi:hypothetical protein